jgi:hypothetical protein
MRGVRYALWALGEASTRQILEYCYHWPGETPRARDNQRSLEVLLCSAIQNVVL